MAEGKPFDFPIVLDDASPLQSIADRFEEVIAIPCLGLRDEYNMKPEVTAVRDLWTLCRKESPQFTLIIEGLVDVG